MLDAEKLQSQVISFVRFPLIVAVVFIHSNPGDTVINGECIYTPNSYLVYEYFRYFISEILARIAVPLFFFISGFLFYRKIDIYNKGVYFTKLKKRVRTLLIPYVFWNLIVIFIQYLTQKYLSGLTSGNNLLITDYTCWNWIKAFWNGNIVGYNTPINYPLWFIRDLMVMVIASPIIYWLIRYLKLYGISLLGILWFFNIWIDIPGISIISLFFFSYGAYYSIHKINFVNDFLKFYPVIIGAYIVTSIGDLFFKETSWNIYIHNIGILMGIAACVSLTASCLNKNIWHVNFQLLNTSFFIYAYHVMPLALVVKCMNEILHPQSDITLIVSYVFSPILVIAIGFWINKFLMKYFPKFTSIITGGR